jgi:hypothetical protein
MSIDEAIRKQRSKMYLVSLFVSLFIGSLIWLGYFVICVVFDISQLWAILGGWILSWGIVFVYHIMKTERKLNEIRRKYDNSEAPPM